MIKKASIEDIQTINLLGQELQKNFASLFHLDTEIDSYIAILLVSKSDKVDGFLYALDLGDNIDLLAIVVNKEKRSCKIGSNLLQYLIDNYCYQKKSITLEVATDNIEALELYRKFGFISVNTRKGYYNGKDAFLMRRN